MPVLVKGILTREDGKVLVSYSDIYIYRLYHKYIIKTFLMIFSALKAIEAGVDGIVVSNHGDRQLDYSPATITVLEEVKPIKAFA